MGGGPGPVHSTDGMLDLSEVVPPGGLGIGKGLADDVLKVRGHGDIRARAWEISRHSSEPAGRISMTNAAGMLLPRCQTT